MTATSALRLTGAPRTLRHSSPSTFTTTNAPGQTLTAALPAAVRALRTHAMTCNSSNSSRSSSSWWLSPSALAASALRAPQPCGTTPTQRLPAANSDGPRAGLRPRPRPRPRPRGQLPPLSRRGGGAAVVAAATAAAAAAGAAGTAAAAPAAAAAAAASSSPLVDLFAVVLGYACLAGSFFRSVPQIAVILRTGSAEGLSLTSNLVELLCFTISVAYNIQQGYAFNTYGEVFACWVQDVIIVGLIFRHLKLGWGTVAAAAAAFAAACAWLFSPKCCPMELLSALQLSTIVVMAVGARLPQIWLNVRRGNAGVLSPLTCLLNVAGCLVRVFTTAVLTRDAIIMGGCVTQLILNAVLLYQSVVSPGTPGVIAASDGPAAATATATAAAAATATATIAATDPPTGGSGGARGQPVGLAAVNGDGSGHGANGDGHSASAPGLAQGSKAGGAGGGDGGDGGGSGGGGGASLPVAVPAAA